ncbi:MAG: cation:proton antiporter, partial [Candidatus Diapherotrites archaeon]|nr:cation:proton antiporter [Candidatus Diapherotrites archaeon]
MSELIGQTLLQLGIILIGAKFAGYIFDMLKQPKVLGELLAGLILGPSLFNFLDLHNSTILFVSELGIIMLLFEAGIESSLADLMKSGFNAFVVACIGVTAPILLSLPYFLGIGLDFNTAFFIGATLTATSVGLTVRVLGEMNKINSLEGKIIIGAAVIDDVIGLVILSVLTDMVKIGNIDVFNVAKVVVLAIVFLVAVIVLGKLFEKRILDFVEKLKVQRTFIISAFIFAIAMSYVAAGIGLATIVGAFAAGLVLEREEHTHHILKNVHVLTQLFAPVFFVIAGAGVIVGSLFDVTILPFVVIVSIIAIVGKIIAGIGAWNVKASKLAIGIGMIP